MACVRANEVMVEVQEATRLLQLVFHRNKNQHHLAKWWKWLSMLKRCLLKLPREDAEAVKARASYMSDFLIPRCHRAFINLIADQQFAALGLVLLANLAKVGRIVGALAGHGSKMSARDARHDRATLGGGEDFGESIMRPDPSAAAWSPQPLPGSKHHQPAMTPDSDGPRHETAISSNAPSVSRPCASSPRSTPKPPKRKRVKANAIDELFDGLA